MGNIYAIAGRPLSGKTQYLRGLQNQWGKKFLFFSAIDYSSFDELINYISKSVMDSDCLVAVGVDDFEVALLREWNGKMDESRYQRDLQILAGLADNYDLDIYFAVGLRREADAEELSYSERFLRADALAKETDGVFFLKRKG